MNYTNYIPGLVISLLVVKAVLKQTTAPALVSSATASGQVLLVMALTMELSALSVRNIYKQLSEPDSPPPTPPHCPESPFYTGSGTVGQVGPGKEG